MIFFRECCESNNSKNIQLRMLQKAIVQIVGTRVPYMTAHAHESKGQDSETLNNDIILFLL